MRPDKERSKDHGPLRLGNFVVTSHGESILLNDDVAQILT